MNVGKLIKGDIEDFCIACLEKRPNMLNLIENEATLDLFTSLFNVRVRSVCFSKTNIKIF